MRQAWIGLFANRNLMLLTFAYGTLGYFQYIFFYWIYYYFGEVLHLGEQASAKYTTILFLTEGAFMPIGGIICDWLTRIYGAQFGRRIVPMSGLTLNAMVFKHSPYPNAAKAFLQFMLEKEQYEPWLNANSGYWAQPLAAAL